jgi:hypothetical protein
VVIDSSCWACRLCRGVGVGQPGGGAQPSGFRKSHTPALRGRQPAPPGRAHAPPGMLLMMIMMMMMSGEFVVCDDRDEDEIIEDGDHGEDDTDAVDDDWPFSAVPPLFWLGSWARIPGSRTSVATPPVTWRLR